MTDLRIDSRFPDPDSAYRLLIDAHRSLGDAESAELNSALILILANHIGDSEVLAQAIELAKTTLTTGERKTPA
ncbi:MULTISPECIES: DUF2783 domain-containing protein [unclassified Beijerinckia]|uniref:DUF2783 domain-containing protein n=1 Tax=unclassified Beijerinckia TaxID=2638183 RepID=UPI0008992F63|nr:MULTISPECIES: DUF2783 domain-containing protein [unclassified Beijerinckia]MDH7796530.1 hypothetical protein [Beijerinckia sp. GAS462]SEC49016.1 Protein of unknown function [Beijerinckia sp. 28-YEA-48]